MPTTTPKACVFDAFGTLFSIRLPLKDVNEKAAGKGAELLDIWRRKQLEYTWLRSLMGAYVNFDVITKEALTFAMQSLGIEDDSLYELLMPIYRQPNCFPEVKPALQHLKARGIATAILSNGTLDMLQAGVQKTGLENLIDHLFSVEDVEIYKPDPKVYQIPLNRLRLHKEEILFFSSNAWDAAGAARFGLPTVWVNKTKQTWEQLGNQPTYEASSLADIREIIG